MAELYWQYVGHGWTVDSGHVQATLHLPVPAGQAVVPGENVRAWAHGPLDGSLSFGDDGSIDMSVPSVDAGGYAEVRTVFPVAWMDGIAKATYPNVSKRDQLSRALEEEERLASQANVARMQALSLIVVCLLISVALIAWALLMFFRHGKEHKPQFTGDYWRDVPEKGTDAAVISRLWNWGAEKQEDFTATLMHLSHVGALRIDAGTYEVPGSGIFGQTKTVNDYYLTRLPGWRTVATSAIDREAMHVLFDVIAPGQEALWFGTITQFGKDNPEKPA